MGETDYDFMQTDLLQYQWSDGEGNHQFEETKPKTIVMKYTKAKSTQELLNYLNVVKRHVSYKRILSIIRVGNVSG